MHRFAAAGLLRRPGYEPWQTALVVLVFAAVGIAAGSAFAGDAHDSVKVAAGGLAVVFGLAGAALAVLRFEAFLLTLFAIRPVLDAFKNGGTGNFAPGVAVGFVFLIVGTLWLVARHRAGRLHRPGNLSIALVVLAVAGGLSVFASEAPPVSLAADLKLASGVLMFLVLEQVVLDDTRRLRPLYVATCCVTIFASLFAIAEGLLGISADGRVRGLFIHENDMAEFLVTVALLMLALRPHLSGALRRLTTISFVLAIPALYLTYTRGAWIGFVLGVLVIGMLQDKRVAAGVLVAVVAAIIFVPGISNRFSDLKDKQVAGAGDPNSLVFREQYWKEIGGFANSTPVIGIGLSMVERSTSLGLPPHNTPLQVWLETGAFGSIAFVWVAGSMTGGLRRSVRDLPSGLSRGWAVGGSAAGAAFGVQMLTDNLLLQAIQLWYLALAVAPALALRRVAAQSAALSPRAPAGAIPLADNTAAPV